MKKKEKQIKILKRLLSYPEFEANHHAELKVFARKLEDLKKS